MDPNLLRECAQRLLETADFIRNLTAAVTSTTQTTTTTTSSSTTAQPQPNSATNRDTVRSEHNRLFGTGRQLRRELLEILIAIKGGGRPTRLLPYAKMLFIPRKFFFLCWVDYALEGSTFSLSKCDFSRMFHTERSWHTYRFTVAIVSGRQDLPSDTSAFSLTFFEA